MLNGDVARVNSTLRLLREVDHDVFHQKLRVIAQILTHVNH